MSPRRRGQGERSTGGGGQPRQAARGGERGPDWLDALVVLALAYLPGSLLVAAVGGLATGPTATALRLGAFGVVLGGCALGWMAVRGGRDADAVAGGRPARREVGVGVVLGGVLGVVLLGLGQALAPLLDALGVEVISPQEGLHRALLDPAAGWAVALVAVTVTPAGEELAFRGVVHRGVRALLPRPLAVAVSAAVFAALHMPGGNLAGSLHVLVTLLVVGAALAGLVERHGHVWSAVAAHAAYNAVGIVGLLVLP